MQTTAELILRHRRLISVVGHIAMIVASNAVAFMLRFDGQVPAMYVEMAVRFLPALIVLRLATFVPFRLFEGLWKYTSLWDLRNIILAVASSSFAFVLITAAVTPAAIYPRSIFILDSLLLICMMSGVRLSRRIYTEMFTTRRGRRVLVYGAGDAGERIVRDMRQNAHFKANPIGYIDDDNRKIGQSIHGVRVLAGRDQLARIMKEHQPEELLIAIPSAPRETVRSIVRALEPFQVKITTLPRIHELIGARVEVEQIRQLKVEDLLARDPIGLDYAPVRAFLKNKRVMVTGAGGSIGSELCRQIVTTGPDCLVLVDRYENNLFSIDRELSSTSPVHRTPYLADITDVPRLNQIFDEARPEVVFHAAAHKHVPLMQDNPCEAVKNNVRGTRIVAEASIQNGVERFILISTDKAVNPTSVMGSTKRIAELMIGSYGTAQKTRFAAVRFGNVLASNGSVVPTFVTQIANGGPVTVTHPEMKRFFMLIPEAVQLVLHAAALPDPAPLFALDMGEQVRVADLARDLIRLSGYVPEKDIKVEFTGMRPGEKLFEEIVGADERAEPSAIDKILRIQYAQPLDVEGFQRSVICLEKLAMDGRSEEVLVKLRALLSVADAKTPHSSPA